MLQELGKPLLSECWLESLNQTVKVWCLSTSLLRHFRNEKEATMEDKRTWECVKNPSKLLSRRTLLLTTIFLSALSSYPHPALPHSPPPPPPPPPALAPPSNVLAPKNFCSKFNFVLGGRGGVTRFTNITGKVPTLLTSIVEPKCVPQVFLGLLLRTGASNSPRK